MIHYILEVIGLSFILTVMNNGQIMMKEFWFLTIITLIINQLCINHSRNYIFQNPESKSFVFKNVCTIIEVICLSLFLILFILSINNFIGTAEALTLAAIIAANLVLATSMWYNDKEVLPDVYEIPFKDYKSFNKFFQKAIVNYGYESLCEEKDFAIYERKTGNIIVNIYDKKATIKTYIEAYLKTLELVHFKIFKRQDIAIIINTDEVKERSKILNHIGCFLKRRVLPIIIDYKTKSFYVPKRKKIKSSTADEIIEIIYK